MASYNTTHEFVQFLNIEDTIPSRNVDGSRTNEDVDTIATGTLVYPLDHAYVIAATYTFYANGVALTETTDYTIDKDSGIITLATGKDITYNGQALTAKYSFCSMELTNTQLQDTLNRANADVDQETNNHFSDSTTETPDYEEVTNEKHRGEGRIIRDYYLNNYPLPEVTTNLDGALEVGVTTVTVDSTSGYPATGVLTIDNEKIIYSSKTDTTFTVTATTIAHADDAEVVPFVIEISTTNSGRSPVFTVLEKDVDYDLDLISGRLYLFDYHNYNYINSMSSPIRLLPNRLRASYLWGQESIPADIKRLELMLAAKDLIHGTLRNNFINGMSNERRESIDVDDAWIQRIIDNYKSIKSVNI